MKSKVILVAEDNPDEALILQIMCERSQVPHTFHIVEDGQKAIDWLSGTGPYSQRGIYTMPDLLLLDLKMPLKNGLEVLEWARAQQDLQKLPIVILTSSDLASDMERAAQLGATKYVVKSAQLKEIIAFFKEVWS